MSDTILKVNNVIGTLHTSDQKLKDTLVSLLRFRPKNYFFNPQYTSKKWDGFKYFFDKKNGTFLSGILPEVQLVLKKLKKEYVFIDERTSLKWAYESIDDQFLNQGLPEGHDKINLHDFQPDYVNQCIKHNRGIVQAPTGCHRKGQLILMYDGTTKKVEDIIVGDSLMGPDGTPRLVLELCRGQDKMYQVQPTKGKSFVVNGEHVLALVGTSNNPCEVGDQIVDVTVNEWMKWSKWEKHTHMLFRVGIDFCQSESLPVDPYSVGVSLECGDKFVPQIYKTSSRDDRLQLLAGVIDTDGSLSRNCYDINLKSERLANDVAFISRSLGLAAYVEQNTKSDQNGSVGTYYRVTISGDISNIPCKLKQAEPRLQKKSVLRTGFKVIDLDVTEDYYGFVLDKDHRYLLDDFTVTHNSGKTFILISLLRCLPPGTKTLFLTKAAGLVHQNYVDMKKWGVPNLGRWYDNHKEINDVICATSHTATFESLKKILPEFQALIVDEVHECMSDVPISAYKKMKKASVRIGISATAFKWDNKKIEEVQKWSVKGHFGPIFKTTTTKDGILKPTDLQERGILSQSDCIIYPVTHPNLAYEPYQNAVTLGIEQNFHFHEIIARLAKSCSGRTLIVVERIEQGEYLKGLIPGASFVKGETKLKDRQPVIDSLLSGEHSIAIVMRQIITAGINVKIHNLINAAGGNAAHNIIQLIGRGLRTANDKDILKYYDFLFLINDYLRKHSEWRISVLKNQGHKITVKEAIDF